MKKYKLLSYIPWIIFPISIIILLIMKTNFFFKLGINFEYIHNLCSFAAIISFFNNLGTESAQTIITKAPIIVGIVTLLLTILFGPIFCSYICPFGTFQKLIRKIGVKLGIKSRKVPNKLHKFLRLIKYIFLMFFILLIIFKSVSLYMNFDPYHAFIRIFYGGITLSGGIYLVIVTLLSLSYDRPFCNYLCPYGAFFNIVSFKRVFKVTRNPDICIDCKICDKSCPVNINVSSLDTVNDVNCLGCNSCISNCPKENAIGLKTNFTKIAVFTALTIVTFFSMTLLSDLSNTTAANDNSEIEEQTMNPIGEHNGNGKGKGKNRKEISDETLNDDIVEIEESIPYDSLIYTDGIYTATVDAYRPNMVVQVEIVNNTIINVEILENNETKSYFEYASPKIIEQILSNNSTNVDTVSRATYTSNGIKNGVDACLEQAKK